MRFSAPDGFTPDWLSATDGVEPVDRTGDDVVVAGSGPLLARVATTLAAHGATPDDLTVERASLEDAFLALTGSARRDG